jgi:hypothetical protein
MEKRRLRITVSGLEFHSLWRVQHHLIPEYFGSPPSLVPDKISGAYGASFPKW